MRIDDYTAQVMAIIEGCKTGAMNADACLSQLEILNDEQAAEEGVTINVTLEHLLEVENIDDTDLDTDVFLEENEEEYG